MQLAGVSMLLNTFRGQFINPLVNECLPVNYTFVDR